MATLLQDIPAWLNILVAASGALVSALNLKRSRWAMVLLGGFVVEIVALLSSLAAMVGLRNGAAREGIGLVFGAAALLGIVGKASVVGGLAGVLSEPRSPSVPAESWRTPGPR
jgi:hypothetical protein